MASDFLIPIKIRLNVSRVRFAENFQSTSWWISRLFAVQQVTRKLPMCHGRANRCNFTSMWATALRIDESCYDHRSVLPVSHCCRRLRWLTWTFHTVTRLTHKLMGCVTRVGLQLPFSCLRSSFRSLEHVSWSQKVRWVACLFCNLWHVPHNIVWWEHSWFSKHQIDNVIVSRLCMNPVGHAEVIKPEARLNGPFCWPAESLACLIPRDCSWLLPGSFVLWWSLSPPLLETRLETQAALEMRMGMRSLLVEWPFTSTSSHWPSFRVSMVWLNNSNQNRWVQRISEKDQTMMDLVGSFSGFSVSDSRNSLHNVSLLLFQIAFY